MDKCRECGENVSDSAKTCPHCGVSKPVKKTSIIKIVLLSIFILWIISIVYHLNGSSNNTTTINDTTLTTSVPTEPEQQWHYGSSNDPMKNSKNYIAYIDSINTVNFGFPYQGEQHATLTLRTNTSGNNEIVFNIEKGQILCQSYEPCTVSVRFDDQDAISFNGVGPSDGSTETVFISNYKRFLAKISKSKKIKIAVNIYQQGAPVFEFNVADFNPGKLKPAK